MPHSSLVGVVLLVGATATLSAQNVTRLARGPRVGAVLGQVLRAAGDFDGDGRGDVLVTEPNLPTYGGTAAAQVHVVSATTGADLISVTVSGAYDATTLADVNGDGHRDLAVSGPATGQVQVFDGVTGGLLFTAGGGPVVLSAIADVGDVTNDGRGDFLAVSVIGSTRQVSLVSGNGGAIVASLPTLSFGTTFDPKLGAMGDVNGDGRRDFAIATGGASVYVCSASPLQVLSTATVLGPGRLGTALGAADVTGDGVDEVLAVREGFPLPGGLTTSAVQAISAATGLVVQTYMPSFQAGLGLGLSRIGDLDADGADDFVTVETAQPDDGIGRMVVFSGARGVRLWQLQGDLAAPIRVTSDYSSTFLDDLGDVDGDGVDDLACGFVSGFDGNKGGYRIVSGRVLADIADRGGACGVGPFLVQLGVTRPVLGGTAVVACRDGVSGVPASLAFSFRPALPTYLGASTCTAHIDVGSWAVLYVTTGTQWSLNVPVPAIPQFAGLEVALQAFYAPTAGPLGFDLSNGVTARLGY